MKSIKHPINNGGEEFYMYKSPNCWIIASDTSAFCNGMNRLIILPFYILNYGLILKFNSENYAKEFMMCFENIFNYNYQVIKMNNYKYDEFIDLYLTNSLNAIFPKVWNSKF